MCLHFPSCLRVREDVPTLGWVRKAIALIVQDSDSNVIPSVASTTSTKPTTTYVVGPACFFSSRGNQVEKIFRLRPFSMRRLSAHVRSTVSVYYARRFATLLTFYLHDIRGVGPSSPRFHLVRSVTIRSQCVAKYRLWLFCSLQLHRDRNRNSRF